MRPLTLPSFLIFLCRWYYDEMWTALQIIQIGVLLQDDVVCCSWQREYLVLCLHIRCEWPKRKWSFESDTNRTRWYIWCTFFPFLVLRLLRRWACTAFVLCNHKLWFKNVLADSAVEKSMCTLLRPLFDTLITLAMFAFRNTVVVGGICFTFNENWKWTVQYSSTKF